MSERVVWGVTGYDIGGNVGYVVYALFTAEREARRYAAENDEYNVEEFTLYEQAPESYTYWHRGAAVYPDGMAKDWTREHSAQPPGVMEAVDDHMDPWDGHTQGHCGLHISIFGTDLGAVEAAFQRQLEKAKERSTGTCPTCGRSSDFKTDFWDGKR